VLRRRWRAVARPLLQLEERHWFFGIEQLRCNGRAASMASDVAANIVGRNSRLAAECGNQNLVQITLSDNCEAVQEKEINHVCGFTVCQLHAFRANLLPGGNHLADDWIDGLGECWARFVDGNIEHANRTASESFAASRYRNIFPLPANAAQAQTQISRCFAGPRTAM
jgi:hypothetical protein